jgi:hypothetical protein
LPDLHIDKSVLLTDAFNDSSIRFILVRHEQAAFFMADISRRKTVIDIMIQGHWRYAEY